MEDFVGPWIDDIEGLFQMEARATAAALGAQFLSGSLHQDPPHRFGGCGKEVATAVPVLGLLDLNEAKVGLVDQRRRLQRLPRFFLGQLRRRELAELVVDERQKLLRGRGVALLDGGQDTGDVAHKLKHNLRERSRPASERASTGGGRVPGQQHQPLGVSYRAAGCPYRDWRGTLYQVHDVFLLCPARCVHRTLTSIRNACALPGNAQARSWRTVISITRNCCLCAIVQSKYASVKDLPI